MKLKTIEDDKKMDPRVREGDKRKSEGDKKETKKQKFYTLSECTESEERNE